MLQGAFMLMLAPGSPLIDYDKGSISFWGDGSQLVEMTTVDDTARMTARVALDRSVNSGKFCLWSRGTDWLGCAARCTGPSNTIAEGP
jgi:nucleoside-diphosphate-sugar epimerase